jgi:hypothetical protein
VGQVIRPGGTLFRVNGSPVILMNGHTPAYRTLSSADTDGADVLELNHNLVALGFNANGIVVDDEWQEATTLGIELLQESLGETATGSLSLGKVVFLPGPQLVSTVEGTVGDTANGGSPATPASGAADPPAPQFVSLTTPADTSTTTTTSTTSTTTGATTTPTTTRPTPGPHHHKPPTTGGAHTPSLAALLALLKAESAQLKAEAEQLKAEQQQNGHGNSPSGNSNGSNKGGGGNKGSGGGSGGGGGGGGGGGNNGSNAGNGASGSTGEAVLQTSSPHLVVTVDLDASLQSEAKVGERVTVQLPAGNTVNGKVTAVSSVAQTSSSGDNGSGNGSGGGGGGGGGGNGGSGSGSGSSSTIPVTITLSGHHMGAGLDQAAVSVNFAQQRANHVLSVPVTALLAVSGGNYAVQDAQAPHSLIPVTVGLFAAGYVEISGPGIHPGLQVTDSQG